MTADLPPLEPLQSRYRLQYLHEEQLNQLQNATLDILEHTGVKFHVGEMLEYTR